MKIDLRIVEVHDDGCITETTKADPTIEAHVTLVDRDGRSVLTVHCPHCATTTGVFTDPAIAKKCYDDSVQHMEKHLKTHEKVTSNG